VKLAVLWFALALAACSITHKSGDYACTQQSDCSGGRVCSQNFCVVPNGGIDAPGTHADAPGTHADAPGTHADAATCPPGCSSCNTGTMTCNIECGAAGAANCFQPITCPTNWNCNITCGTSGSCRQGVVCTNSNACNVTCSGATSCRGVKCGDGPCTVTCSGVGSCNRDVECGNSCQCNVNCTNLDLNTCPQGQIFCGNACDGLNGGCTATPANACSNTCQ